MNKNKIFLIFISIVCFISIFSISLVLAKYIKIKNSNIGISSDKFYFTINLLGNTNTDDSLEKEYHLYGGDSKTIGFSVQNYFDELRYTESYIKYTIEIVEGNTFSNLNVDVNNQFVGGSCESKQCLLNISEEYSDGDVVKIKVSSTEPYTKTMYLIFILHSYTTNLSVSLNDSVGSLYFEIIIDSNVNINAKNLIIDYSDINSITDELQVDLTNNYLLDEGNSLITNKLPDGKLYLDKVTITKKINNGEALNLYFFKTKPSENYKELQVTIIEEVSGSDLIYTIKLQKEGGM